MGHETTKSRARIVAVGALALLLSTGCGEGPTGSAPDAGHVMPPVDSGVPDAGAPSACETATDPCTVAWQESPAYPTPVDHHVSFAHRSEAGSFVYVAGGVHATNGNPSDVFSAVRRARVNENGALDAWESLTSLPLPLGFQALARTEERVYLVAGITRSGTTLQTHRAVLVGDLDAQGDLSWRTGPELPEAFLHPSAQVLGDRLYVVGGSGAMSDPKDKVYVGALDAGGMVESWNPGPALPEPRSHHLTVVRDGRLYVVGGFRADHTPSADILRSVHDGAGALTGWEVVGTMQSPPWTAAGFVHGDWLYVVGGGEGGPGEERYVGRVRRALFDAEGHLPEGFEDVPSPLPVERAHVHQTPVVNGRLYSVGGRDALFNSLVNVFVGSMIAE